jgi:hypothetical protein
MIWMASDARDKWALGKKQLDFPTMCLSNPNAAVRLISRVCQTKVRLFLHFHTHITFSPSWHLPPIHHLPHQYYSSSPATPPSTCEYYPPISSSK